MKNILLVLSIAVVASCNNSRLVTEKAVAITPYLSCKEYFAFIKSEWHSTNNQYSFKNDPEYWKDYNKFHQLDCLKDNNFKTIKTIFGLPTKQFIFPESIIWIYCMSEECKDAFIEYKNKKELLLTFDKNGKLKGMAFNPTFQMQN